MKISLTNKITFVGQILLVGLLATEKKRVDQAHLVKSLFFQELADQDKNFVRKSLQHQNNWTEGTQTIIHLPSHPDQRLLFISLGETKDWSRKKTLLALRQLIGALKNQGAAKALIELGSLANKQTDWPELVRQAAVNLLLADFSFNQYKERPKVGWPEIASLEIFLPKLDSELKNALQEGTIIGSETNHCRTLANTPGGDLTPAVLASKAKEEVKKAGTKFKVKVLDENEMKRLGMGGILGVSRGSLESPRFIILEYQGAAKSRKPLVYVGKGVTFDTGGLNLKPDTAIYEMHMDMSGGAAVIHAISAIAQLGWPINIIGLVPAAENMPSGSSYRPGDILKTITGKTIEVLNTDAEGRIILADALGYALKYQPELIVDVATLTGAALVALGQRATALFTSDEKLERLARQVGEAADDPVWPLPIWDDYFEDIKGTFADVANTGKNRYGGAITGAVFLKQFVGDNPWIHLDIAPTMTTIDGQFLAKGASGTAVRFLVELARKFKKS